MSHCVILSTLLNAHFKNSRPNSFARNSRRNRVQAIVTLVIITLTLNLHILALVHPLTIEITITLIDMITPPTNITPTLLSMILIAILGMNNFYKNSHSCNKSYHPSSGFSSRHNFHSLPRSHSSYWRNNSNSFRSKKT